MKESKKDEKMDQSGEKEEVSLVGSAKFEYSDLEKSQALEIADLKNRL